MRTATVLIVLAASISVAEAGAPSAARKKVTVEGWADIQGGDIATARELAITRARQRAIEQVAGVHIQTMISDTALAKIKDGKETFEQQVNQRIYSKSVGFVVGHTIISYISNVKNV